MPSQKKESSSISIGVEIVFALLSIGHHRYIFKYFFFGISFEVVKFPELVAASYGENSTSDVDPDGVALIWNTKFAKETPEYIFQCQSRVTKAKFAK